MIRFHAFFVFICLFALSCSETSAPNYSPYSSFSIYHFEGIAIGDSIAQVSSHLGDYQAIANEELKFSKKVSDDCISGYDGYLVFDNDKLFEITIDFHLASDSLINDYFMECKLALDEVYGTSEMDNGYAHWSTGSVNQKVIEIELFNEFLDSRIPVISVQFFEDFEKKFYAE